MTDFDAAPEGFRASIVTLHTLLSKKGPLITPRYQRPYSWTDFEVTRLFADLLEAFGVGRPYYFMGTIVVIAGRAAEIVDGQQRLATFTLLLAALRDRLPEGSPTHTLAQHLIADTMRNQTRLLLREADRAFIAVYVHTPGQFAELCELDEDAERPSSQTALILAARAIATALDAEQQEEAFDLEGFTKFVAKGAVFNLIETDDRDNAPRMFTVLNETGLDLSATDLVKSELFVRAGFTESEADDAGRAWDQHLDRLGRRGMDELLSFMPAIATRKVYTSPGDFTFFRRNFTDVVDPRRFLTSDLSRYVRAYEGLTTFTIDGGPLSAEINRRARCLANLRERGWLGVAIGFVADHEDDPKLVARLMQALERYAYALLFNVVPANARLSRANKIFGALGNAASLLDARSPLMLSPGEMREMQTIFRSPFRRDHFRRRFILLRLNAALPNGEVLAPTDDATVEHVLPVKAKGAWERAFPDAQVRETLTHSCGNMALLTQVQNALAADKSYAEKREIYFETPNAPLRALTASIQSIPEWTPAAIRNRTKVLMDAIERDLGLEAG
ncbi:MAG: DUF262 domain-containing protein [Alphaproteobacteria bacterium]|nr:DUF262 domain-containing protein [Alphaproteobacteria bacterium]